MRERRDDITGGLMCTKAEVPTSAVTGRGRASIPYVGHISHMQLTNQAAWRWSVNPPLEVNLKLPVTGNMLNVLASTILIERSAAF